MKNTDIDNVVRKHKSILGLPQGFGKKPVAEKIKILNTKARSKNVALKGFIDDYNKLKAKQGTGSKVGGKGGKGGATKTGKMVKDYKKPPKGMGKSIVKPPKKAPKEGVASGGTPVPTVAQSSQADSNVFNLNPSNLIASAPEVVPEGIPYLGDDDDDDIPQPPSGPSQSFSLETLRSPEVAPTPNISDLIPFSLEDIPPEPSGPPPDTFSVPVAVAPEPGQARTLKLPKGMTPRNVYGPAQSPYLKWVKETRPPITIKPQPDKKKEAEKARKKAAIRAYLEKQKR